MLFCYAFFYFNMKFNHICLFFFSLLDNVQPGELYVKRVGTDEILIGWGRVTAPDLTEYVLAAFNDLGILVNSGRVAADSNNLCWLLSSSTGGPLIQPATRYDITLNGRDAGNNDLASNTLQQYTSRLNFTLY